MSEKIIIIARRMLCSWCRSNVNLLHTSIVLRDSMSMKSWQWAKRGAVLTLQGWLYSCLGCCRHWNLLSALSQKVANISISVFFRVLTLLRPDRDYWHYIICAGFFSSLPLTQHHRLACRICCGKSLARMLWMVQKKCLQFVEVWIAHNHNRM